MSLCVVPLRALKLSVCSMKSESGSDPTRPQIMKMIITIIIIMIIITCVSAEYLGEFLCDAAERAEAVSLQDVV